MEIPGDIDFAELFSEKNVCLECGDVLHHLTNFCPRCLVPVFSEPDAIEEIKEINDPGGVECVMLSPDIGYIPVLSLPDIKSRRLIVMTDKDVVILRDETDPKFYKVRTINGIEGYVFKKAGIKVKVGMGEVKPNQSLGYFRVYERLLGWRSPSLPYKLNDVAIKTQPRLDAPELARIQADITLPIVGETYGWVEVQLPSFFRGWVPEANGYRLIRSDSMEQMTKPKSTGEIIASIAGTVAVVTLAGVGAGINEISKEVSRNR